MTRRAFFLLLSPFFLIIVLLILFTGLLQSAGLLTVNFAASLVELGVPLENARQVQAVTQIITRFNLLLRLLFVPIIFIIALIFHRLNWRLASWLLSSNITRSLQQPNIIFQDRLSPEEIIDYQVDRAQHRQTLQYLIASLISLTAFSIAVLLTVLQFVNSAGIALMITVTSTALGFGARDYINDLIMGLTDIFEDDFNVGEKIEIVRLHTHLEGVVTKVNVRTTTIQTPAGVPVTIPNGEIRVLRNFSRGKYSSTSISFPIQSSSLDQSLQVLKQLSAESVTIFPDLIEPLQIISRSGVVGSQTELLVLGKALYGQAADLRLRLFTEIQERLKLVQS